MGKRYVSIGAVKPANSWAGFYNLQCYNPWKRVISVDVVSRVRDGHPSHNYGSDQLQAGARFFSSARPLDNIGTDPSSLISGYC